ncbi:hypothetical protein SeMB42_g02051 [Synchytrium endobioticum]|uniref:Pop1 N-terminal domain-containing protein n=1 Tax=Synchytrium endobioticum TaxID=286115 RepID=A0A507DI91_9FUNG|nr:hypothetical protein SeMB42_g02051 [Synchytrium endobioticum]
MNSAGAGKKRPRDATINDSQRQQQHHNANRDNRPNKRAKQEMRVQGPALSRPTASSAMAQAPRSIHVSSFAESRAFEIQTMEKALDNATEFTGKQRVYQTLPRHMRRRAASHNVKRLPRRVQQRAKTQEANEPPRRERKPSKRRKKLVKSTQEEYKSRQLTKRWLETHVWHAKRMKMVELWGYRLADHPNEKSLRSSFRAGKTQCCIHDASYIGTLEISGSLNPIKNILDSVTDPSMIPVTSARHTSGVKSGESYLYTANQFPFGAVCPFTFIWKPLEADNSNDENVERALWLFIHPSAYREAYNELENICTRATGVSVKRLDTELVRFELSGPRAHAILEETLQIPSEMKEMPPHQIWSDLLCLRTPVSLPPGVVFGLTVDDPRLSFPPKIPSRPDYTPSGAQAKIDSHLMNWPMNASKSDLWDATVRGRVAVCSASESELNHRRSQHLIPGTKVIPTEKDARVPVLLIQRAAAYCTQDTNVLRRSRGLADGWDVIVPKEWGRAFWKSFIFAGARAGGLRERHSSWFESGLPCFPYEYPETNAGRRYSMGIQRREEEKWERRPPAKRISFAKLGVKSPFRPPFETLVPSLPDKLNVNQSDTNPHASQNDDRGISKEAASEFDAAVAMGMGMEVDIETVLGHDEEPKEYDDVGACKMDTASDDEHDKLPENNEQPVEVHAEIPCWSGHEEYEYWIKEMKKNDWEKQLLGGNGGGGAKTDVIPSDTMISGYVITGHFSLSQAKGVCIGSCTLKSLWMIQQDAVKYKRDYDNFILVRNPTGRLCRPATFTVIA